MNRPGPFLPTLFDRLQDDEPGRAHEHPDVYAPDRERMRQLLRRDIELLLGTVNHEEQVDRARYPQAAASALNYGLPALAGGWALARRWSEVEQLIRRALLEFEPRLAPDTLVVSPLWPAPRHAARPASADEAHRLRFEISGEVRLKPYPLVFRVQTAVDLETRRVTLET